VVGVTYSESFLILL